jgi:hypothetical protein
MLKFWNKHMPNMWWIIVLLAPFGGLMPRPQPIPLKQKRRYGR